MPVSIAPPRENATRAVQARLESLNRSWKETFSKRSVTPTITLEKGGVFLGVTRLAPQLQGYEARIHALVSYALGFVAPETLARAIRAAKADYDSGDRAMALMRLALVVPTPCTDLENYRKLHLAAGLLNAGLLSPADLLALVNIPAKRAIALEKYSPDQPRVPAGNSDGGQWTAGEADGTQTADASDGCAEEWAWALNYCIQLLRSPNPSRSLTGGHRTPEGCAKGFVSQRCGGNKV